MAEYENLREAADDGATIYKDGHVRGSDLVDGKGIAHINECSECAAAHPSFLVPHLTFIEREA